MLLMKIVIFYLISKTSIGLYRSILSHHLIVMGKTPQLMKQTLLIIKRMSKVKFLVLVNIVVILIDMNISLVYVIGQVY